MRKLLIFLLITWELDAKDLGRMGNVFEIAEESFLKMIMRRLKEVDIGSVNKLLQAKVKSRFYHPQKSNLTSKATKNREKILDISYTLQEDIVLPCGNILYKKGYKLNPLDKIDLDMEIFLLNADDDEQIKWLQHHIKKGQKEVRIILVAGSPYELSEKLNMEVYFDQFGEISTRFGIKNIPVKIWQNPGEKFLRIREYKM